MNTNLNLSKFKQLPEAVVFRHLRIKAKLKVRDLALLLGVTHTLICHYESGRQKIPEQRLKRLCQIFKVTAGELKDFQEGREPLPINYKDECILLVSRMGHSQLQAVYGMLSGMVGKL